MERGEPILNRLPSTDERDRLQARHSGLTKMLRPLSYSSADKESAEKAIMILLAGFPALANRDARGMVVAFAAHVADLPLFAVRRACEDIPAGRVMVRDDRGNQVKFVPDHALSSPRLYEIAARYCEEPRARLHAVARVLGTKRIAPPPIPAEEREATAAKLRDLASNMSLRAREQREREDRARQDAKARRADHERDSMMAEYADAGIDPVTTMGGTMIVSPSLIANIKRNRDQAQKINHARRRRAKEAGNG